MTRQQYIFAGIGGLFGAGIVFAIFVPKKIKELQQRAQSTSSGGIRAQANAARLRIAQQAETITRQLARQTAESYLAEIYGLTPDRMARLDTLGRALGR